ncbi:hypothetical protein ENKNEFLB_00778 [Nocardioides aquaticus]|uniref:Uncharacterized protein n=1 Tax=Nocardioides aquaticus TaxID=160826 RepID=A0ABX8EDR8_9ACTN|nr:hypothetical protein [Nocardioides aquaticus]QVT78401.1 hypothetical protein ENKNEFLB_00778 [Nocardioides aquaticus]
MKCKTLVRLAAAATCGMLAVGAGGAYGSNYAQDTVVNATSERWVPHVADTPGEPKAVANTIAEAGSQMVVGGRFKTVQNGSRSTQYSRSNVFAFDAATGALNEGFAPNVDGVVWSTLSDGTSVWIGGTFRNVNGTARATLAKLDLATGQLDTAFNARLKGGRVSDLELVDGQLIVAGTIRSRLMSVDPNTGAVTDYIQHTVEGKLPNSDAAQVFKFDVSDDGQHLAAVGNFTGIDGQARPRMFMLDLAPTGSTLSSWNYEPNGINCTSPRANAQAYLQDVDFAPGSSWFAVAAFGFMYQNGQRGLQLCDSVSRFETDNLDPVSPTWINYSGGDSLKSVAVTGAAVYVQGHSRWLDNPFGVDFAGPGAVSRLGGGAVDPNTGMALDWNPVMPQQSGGFQILPTSEGVWFATDGTRFGGRYARGIRFAALP